MNFIERVKNLLLAPKLEWQTISGEKHTVQDIYAQYLVLLAGLPAAGHLLSFGRYGGFSGSLRVALVSYLAVLIGAYVTGLAVDHLAPNFSSNRSLVNAFKVVVYGITPILVAGALAMLPGLGELAVLAGAVYSLYLLYLGLPVLMGTPEEKVVSYMIVAFMACMIVYFVLGSIFAVFFGVSFWRQ